MNKHTVTFKCEDCGLPFEVEQGSRRKYCDNCEIRIAATTRANAEIADNLRSYWANLNAGSAK